MQKKPLDLSKLPGPKVEIINLIDVLITLVAFFLLTTVFADQLDQLQVNLPQVEAGVTHPVSTGILIEMDKKNNIYLNEPGQHVSKEELIRFLQKNAGRDLTVTIQADKDCNYEEVIRLLDLVRRCGYSRAALEVSRN
ncbi:MAG TPA: biopolymer transporter ExbD [Firmicutes bacterium]|nr:biopolymer transporter ExbD [Bacillota bacterium]